MLPLLIGIYVPSGEPIRRVIREITGILLHRVNKQYRLIFKWVNGKAEEFF